MTTDSISIAWGGFISPGQEMRDNDGCILESWISSHRKIIYCNHYRSKRIIKICKAGQIENYNIDCNIYASSLKIPLFILEFENAGQRKTITSSNPTSVVRKLFHSLGTSPKKNWNGHHFFGLDRKDVPKPCIDTDSDAVQVSIENDHGVSTNRNAVWVGVKSLGRPTLDKKYEYTACGKTIILQPDFESVRAVKINKTAVNLHCKVEESDSGPTFRCFTLKEPLMSCSSITITTAVKSALSQLGYLGKKK